ncbi:DUF2516 family protein [Nocardioides terrisoli]|uniref:DUF2516 family protein n=1 Tax=Nocardioides terrisoli TaxID=3388267 RepID=UPI00287BC6A3|nr:DUF2516 family protein [Nocardioides marmorisolisilvae]
MAVFDFEYYTELVLFVLMAALEVFAFVDAVLRPAAGFTAAGKLSKPAWLLILALAMVTCVAFQSPMSILGLLGIVAAGVYLADVRPAVAAITRR